MLLGLDETYKCATVVGHKRPPENRASGVDILTGPPGPIPARPAQKVPRLSTTLPASIVAAVGENATRYHALLQAERRIDQALARGRNSLEASIRLTPSASSAAGRDPGSVPGTQPLAALSGMPAPLTRSLRVFVSTRLEELAAPQPGETLAERYRWTLQLWTGVATARAAEAEGAAEAGPSNWTELGAHLSSVRVEVNTEPPTVVEWKGPAHAGQAAPQCLQISRAAAALPAQGLAANVSLTPKTLPVAPLEQRLYLSKQALAASACLPSGRRPPPHQR